jgi:hypothetical protein
LFNCGTAWARLRFNLGCVAFAPPNAPHPNAKVTAADFLKSEAMNTEKLESHHEGWRTLWLAIAGVMAIMLTWNVLMLSLNGISY